MSSLRAGIKDRGDEKKGEREVSLLRNDIKNRREEMKGEGEVVEKLGGKVKRRRGSLLSLTL